MGLFRLTVLGYSHCGGEGVAAVTRGIQSPCIRTQDTEVNIAAQLAVLSLTPAPWPTE